MRIVGLILGILGGMAAAVLGIVWLRDYNTVKSTVDAAIELSRSTGTEVPPEFAELKRLVIAAYLLLAAGAIGIAGGVLTLLGRGKIAGPLMIVAALVPVLLAPKALVFSSILLVAGVVCFLAKPKVAVATPTFSQA